MMKRWIMFQKKDKMKDKSVDYGKLNEVIGISQRILRIVYVLLVIVAIYIVIILFKELNLRPTIMVILKTISPLFIGLLIAWLFDPFVKWLKKKGIRRGFGTLITYILLIGGLVLLIGTIIPVLSGQINDFVKTIPSVFSTVQGWVDQAFNKLNNVGSFDALAMKAELFKKIEEFGNNLTNSLPEMTVNFVSNFFSGASSFIVGLIIGFYLLMSFDNAGDMIITLLPKKIQNDTRDLFNDVNTSLRRFVHGAVLDCLLIFVVSSLGLWLVGLKAPLLFGLFCGITNIIPFAGPYIGGAPAVIVGFSQSPMTGIFTLVVIAIIQFVEGNFLQPLVMSKTTKLHPVTIILGLLVFGYFFGIIGMAISTPIITAFKSIFMFFDEKYGILNYND